MSYQCVQARFLFFNGKKSYTVEFGYAVSMWYIFEEEKTTDAVYRCKVIPNRMQSPNRQLAEGVLNDYLNGE